MKPMFASTVCLLHKISRLGLILALGLLVGAAQASETAAWTGGSGFFTNGANWNTGIAPTNLGDTANITNATAGYTITLYNPTSTVTNNLLVVSNATMIITQAVMTVSNTLATSSNPQNNNLSQGTLTLWSGGHLEIDNGGTLNITASTTNTDIAWNDPNGLVVLNNGGTLYATGQQNCAMCSNAGWTTHITSTAASTTGSVFNYGGNRLLYVGRYVSNSTLIIDNGVAVSNLWTVTLGQNGTNNAILVTNKASLWFTGISGQSLNIGNAVGSVSNSVVVSNAFLYGPQFTIGGYNGANYNNLIITSGSLCSNAGAINIGGVSTNGFGNYFILNNSTLVCNPFVNSSLQIGGGTTNSSNYAAIVNGSTATESAVTIGGSTGSVYNYLLVSNATLKLTNTSTTAINIAGGAPCASNYLLVANGALLNVAGGLSINASVANVASNNYVTFNNATGIFKSAGLYLGYATAGVSPIQNNGLIITNGATVTFSNAANNTLLNMFGSGNYVLIAGTNVAGKPAILDFSTNALGGFVVGGSGPGVSSGSGSGCCVRVDAGGVLTNFSYRCAIGSYASGYSSCFNTLIITNGGRAFGMPSATSYGFNIGGLGASSSSYGGVGNGLIVSGPGSVFDWSMTTNNSSNANLCSLNVPYFMTGSPVYAGFGTNNYMLIDNGGLVKMFRNNGAYVSVGAQINAISSNSVGNTITILSGGTLEAMALYATNSAGGNNITNYGGIYQFASSSQTPAVTNSGNGAGIYLNCGTIAYRSTTNADVTCNRPGGPLDGTGTKSYGMTFLGTNVFRLNWATNLNTSHQAYTFDPNLGATNFYRLEMVNGYTCYHGTNGDALTIGSSVGSGGQMLCSNTTAQVNLIFTNNGTLSIENSTLTLGANATINGGIVIDLNNLTSGQVAGTTPVIQASSNLTITGASTLTLLGATSTNMPLINYSGTLNGTFSSVVGLPQNTIISYGSGRITLIRQPGGTMISFCGVSSPPINSVPYTNTWDFTTYANGYAATNLPGWNAGLEDLSVITNLLYTYTNSCGLPLTNATQTQALQLNTYDSILTNNVFSTSSTTGSVFLDTMVQFVPSANTPVQIARPGDVGLDLAVFANSSSNLVIYHGWLDSYGDGSWASNGLSVLTNWVISATNWYRLTIQFDGSTSNLFDSTLFPCAQVYINGTLITSPDAYNNSDKGNWPSSPFSHPTSTSPTGTWFRIALNDSADPLSLLQNFGSVLLQGTGFLDDFQVVLSNPCPFNTLTVISSQGGAFPGTTTLGYGSGVTEWITNSPVVNGTTQYVCTGASIDSNAFTQVSPTNITLTLMNNANLTWQWQTQYWLTLATSGAGSGALSTTSAWYATGNNAVVTATPGLGSTFTGWSGATNGCTINGAQITTPMNSAISVTANFGIAQETLTISTAYGTPTPGMTTVNYGTPVTETINSPVLNGSTQYVCTGASVAGLDPTSWTQVNTTNVSLALTNNANLTWQWQTLYWLATATNGSGSVTASSWYNAGSNAVITATPAANWHFVSWSGATNGCTINGAQITIPVNSALSVTANFAVNTETLTVVSVEGMTSPGTTTVNYGTPVTELITNTPVLDASSVTQYVCTGAAVAGLDATSYTQNDATNYTLTMTNAATLAWQWQTQYWLATATNGSGSVTPGGWYNAGTNSTVTATPAANWYFTGWSGNTNGCVVAGNLITVPMTQPTSVVANFALVPETLSVVSAEGGAFPGTTTLGYGSGVAEWITNSPVVNGATQYVCVGAAVAGLDSTSWTQVSTTNVFLTLTNNANLTWQWQTQYWLATAMNGSGSVTPSGWCNAGTNVTVTATAAANWYFTGWSGATNGCVVAGNLITVPMIQPTSVVANFALVPETLSVVSAEGGASPGTTTLGYGSGVAEWITNSPVVNGTTQYVCTGASVVGLDSTSWTQVSPTNVTLTLTNNATLTWQWQTQYWLATATNGNGSVTPSGWYNAGSNVVITATPAANSSFIGWSGDVQSTSNPLVLNMGQPYSIVAQFASNLYAVQTSADRYWSPGTNTIQCTFYYPSGQRLGSLSCQPSLPAGWTLGTVSGDESPDLEAGSIVFTGPLVSNPISFQYTAIAPAGETGLRQFTTALEYWIPAQTDNPVDIQATPNPLILNRLQNLVVASAYENAAPTVGTNIYVYGTSVNCSVSNSPIVVGVNTQIVCTGWSATGSIGSGVGTNILVMLTNDTYLTWLWQTQYGIAAAAQSNGTVVGSNGWYASGATATFTAVPTNGFFFVNWSGDLVTTNNPVSLTANKSYTLVANFASNAIAQHSSTWYRSPGTNVITCTFSNCTGQTLGSLACEPVLPAGWTLGSVSGDEAPEASDGAIVFTGSLQKNPISFQYTVIIPPGVTGQQQITSLLEYWIPSYMSNPLAIPANPNPLELGCAITLNVQSALGGTTPTVGISTNLYGTVLSCAVTNSPIANGTTQYVCTGASVVGLDSTSWTQVNATNAMLTLTNNATLTWQWQTQYWLATATNGNGSVTPSGWYNAGTNATVTATPAANWYFTGWSGATNGSVMAGTLITVPMTQAASVVANFALVPETLSVVSAEGGVSPGTTTLGYGSGVAEWITNSPVVNGTTQYVCAGASVDSNAFTQVSPTNVTLTLTNSANLTWQWQTQYWLGTSVAGNGTVSTNGWEPQGAAVVLSAMAGPNCHFVQWTGAGVGAITSGNVNSPTVTVTMIGPASLVANFAIDQHTLTVASPYGATVPALGVYTNLYGTVLSCAVTNSPVVNGTTQYVCTGWSGTGSVIPATGSTTNTPTFTLTNDSTIVWFWKTQFCMTATAGVGGTVSASNGWLDQGSQVLVQAQPISGFVFANWSGNVLGGLATSNPLTLDMNQSWAITANFAVDLTAISVSDTCSGYRSPATGPNPAVLGTSNNIVTCQFAYPTNQQLTSFTWVPTLPATWSFLAPAGNGNPSVSGTNIVFSGPLTNNPLVFKYQIGVPGNASTTNLIQGTAVFAFANMAQNTYGSIAPATIPVQRFHSADYLCGWTINASEVSRFLAYWRFGYYYPSAVGLDGFEPSSTPVTNNISAGLHSADYRAPYWSIDVMEASRVLAYWRAGGYHVSAAGLDGYAPGQQSQPLIVQSLAKQDAQAKIMPLDVTSITQSAPVTYVPGQSFTVTNTLTYSGSLLSLTWTPILPSGWTVTNAACANGSVEVNGGSILWEGLSLPPSPIVMTYSVCVPPTAVGTQQLQGNPSYWFAGSDNPVTNVYATPNPLILSQYQSGTNTGSTTGTTLRITGITVKPSGNVTLSWLSVSNNFYTVLMATNLSQPFVPLSGASNIAATPLTNIFNTLSTNSVNFYRVEQQ